MHSCYNISSILSYIDSVDLKRKSPICLSGTFFAIDRVKIIPFARYLRAISEISKLLGVCNNKFLYYSFATITYWTKSRKHTVTTIPLEARWSRTRYFHAKQTWGDYLSTNISTLKQGQPSCYRIKSNESCFDVRTEWMLYNTVSICVSCKHLKTKKNKIFDLWTNIYLK